MSFANGVASLNAEPRTEGSGAVRNHLSTALVKLYRELFGRGPVTTTTYAFDAGYVTFLREVLAPHERLLVLGGHTDLVCQARAAIREAERERLIGEVQRVTGRPVLHDSFQFQPERNLAIELFWTPHRFRGRPGQHPGALRRSRESRSAFQSHGRAARGHLPHTSRRRARPDYRGPPELGARCGMCGRRDGAARPVGCQLHRHGRAAGPAQLGTRLRRARPGVVHRRGIQRGVAARRVERHQIAAAAGGAA